MTWKPLHPTHAIERARLVFEFTEPLPEKILGKLNIDIDHRRSELGFTSKNKIKTQHIVLSPNGLQNQLPQAGDGGWSIQRLSSSNEALETLILDGNVLVYETADYSNWNEFVNRFEKVALLTLRSVLDVLNLGILKLEYIDRFNFAGKAEQAIPGDLVTIIDGLLHEEAVTGKALWHVHRGWFETINGEKVLINQNIDCQEVQKQKNRNSERSTDQEMVRSVQLFTKAEMRDNLKDLDYTNIKTHFEAMHIRANQIFASVLTVDAQKKVGLGGLE